MAQSPSLVLTVRGVDGSLLWGPAEVDWHMPVATLRHMVADRLHHPTVAVRLVHGSKVLAPHIFLSTAGIQTGAELTAVILARHAEAHQIFLQLCEVSKLEPASFSVSDDPDSVVDFEVSMKLEEILAGCGGRHHSLADDVEAWLEVLITSGKIIQDECASPDIVMELSSRQLLGELTCHRPGLLYLMADSVDMQIPGPCYDEMVTRWGFFIVDLNGELTEIAQMTGNQPGRKGVAEERRRENCVLNGGPGSVWYASIDEYHGSPWLAAEVPPSLEAWQREFPEALDCVALSLTDFFKKWASTGELPCFKERFTDDTLW
mmetsp:Transcript_122506/g.225785  ORF Transcript_122506/g.225785 Transcript_122506/m.225785 type:complete len:319 (+) Transcript_122506:68-1024(+)